MFENSCALCSAAAYCCGAVAPCAIAALLGRFLPRLGPLAIASGPFFFGVFERSIHQAFRGDAPASNLESQDPDFGSSHARIDGVYDGEKNPTIPPQPGTGRDRREKPWRG